MSLTWDDTPTPTPPMPLPPSAPPRLQQVVADFSPDFISPAYKGVLTQGAKGVLARPMLDDLPNAPPAGETDAEVDARFARVRARAESKPSRFIINGRERFGRVRLLAAADADADDTERFHLVQFRQRRRGL